MVTEVRDQQWRLIALCVLFAAGALLLLYRTYSYQVVQHERYSDLASETHQSKKPIIPTRGNILDRNGNPLAVTVNYDSLYARPSMVKDPFLLSGTLAGLVNMPQADALAKLRSDSKAPTLIKSKLPSDVSTEVSTRIAALKLQGVFLQREPARSYPEGNIAPQLLGFVGKDFNGLTGLELSLDKELGGVPGQVDAERDTAGDEIPIGYRQVVAPTNGRDAILTIDRYIQKMVERELASALKEYKAQGGVIIVMDPKTGEILAMANSPTYDLTAESIYDPAKEALYKTTLVTDMYEPGSVMKIATMAGGLQERVVSPDTTIMDTGSVTVDGVVIHNWDFRGPGKETMTQVLINSANVGAQYVSGLLGPERFYKYVKLFGFGQLTGIDLPGEVAGKVRTPKDEGWSRIDLATNSFGQGIAVTPLQMMMAVAAVANDGMLMKPMIVKGFREGDAIRQIPPTPVRRVISSETAKTLTGMLIRVVEENSLRLSAVPGYKIAGKTGTAELPTASGYTSGTTYASAAGFAPAYDPKWAVLVRIDGSPKVYGGQVASPVLKKVAEQLFTYMRIPPTEPIKGKSGAAR